MPERRTVEIPIRPDTLVSDADREVADAAHNLWPARDLRSGLPEDDLLAAAREVRGKTPAGLFLVPKRNSTRSDLDPLPAISRQSSMSEEQQEIADLAYELWLARGFGINGSPEESFLRAVLEVTFWHGNHAAQAGLFLVPKPAS